LAAAAFADAGLMYRDVRTIGMGGAVIAGGRGGIDFVSNPALLGKVKLVSFSIPAVSLYINDDLRDIAQFVSDNQDKFESIDTLSPEEKDVFIKDVEPYDGRWARVNVSPMVAAAASFLGTSVGLAAYSSGDIGFKIDRGIYEPRVWGEGVTNTVINLGVARSLLIYPGLTVGANLKYVDRRAAPVFQIRATSLGNTQEIADTIVDSVNDNSSTHEAMDFGALLEIPLIESEVGASIRNFGYGKNASVDIGIVKRFWGDRVALLADYADFLDNRKENIFRKIHAGGEVDFGPLELRAGLNAGYPTAGVGIDFRVLRIDAAYFVDELSKAPGGKKDERLAAQIRLGW
jgi:hypothetical protein